ncbi:MAG: tRNA (adenosine(37)-N6)-dimethylallyltransferase MiaA [Candidatus Moranbacteria bacterium]|nr:tRNA (adenosine(37)-N6)-dimethylallyltransferase MiaA [Candidatus Moranbacteria bacterium]
MHKPKIIVILGQTATGKSDFAVNIAKKVDGEIISADSRQVYKGMDLGTGKITKKEMGGVPHYLLDIVSPKNKIFSVSDYQKIAIKKIDEILKRGKTPIICGGTGYYIDSIIKNISFPEVQPNKMLREELSKKTTLQLFSLLKKIDQDRSKNIDANNRVRLIRAIEIAKALGKVPQINKGDSPFDLIKIGLIFPNEELKQRIYIRLIKRMKLGMLKEMENLHRSGVSWKKMESFGLEYRYSAFYLQGKISKEEMVEKLFSQIWHFAKRQNTWFKKDRDIVWINPSKKTNRAKTLKDIDEFLKK